MASDFELADGDDGFAGFRDKITHAFWQLPNPTGGIPRLLDGDEVALEDEMGGHEVWSIRRGEKLRRL